MNKESQDKDEENGRAPELTDKDISLAWIVVTRVFALELIN